MSRTIHSLLLGTTIALTSVAINSNVHAQITQQQLNTGAPGRVASLEEQLVNRLRATTADQRTYNKAIVTKVDEKKLDERLVFAVVRYAIRRNRYFPFPFFQRAMRYEAAKRRVTLPSVQEVASTRARLP
ncbi:MAG: hypothetical protein VYA84_18085 [Planctomycetota bacterium]|nr:hypothetical protein [Planctomycetota bacterium]